MAQEKYCQAPLLRRSKSTVRKRKIDKVTLTTEPGDTTDDHDSLDAANTPADPKNLDAADAVSDHERLDAAADHERLDAAADHERSDAADAPADPERLDAADAVADHARLDAPADHEHCRTRGKGVSETVAQGYAETYNSGGSYTAIEKK